MKRVFAAAGVFALALSTAGCQTAEQTNAANGAVLGGAAGALIGGLASGRAGGALAGAALGAGTGALVGVAATPRAPAPGYYPPPPRAVYVETAPPPARCVERAYDEAGNPICLRYYGY